MVRCSRCKEEKSEAEFYKDKSRPNRCSSYCRSCHSPYGKERHRVYKAKRDELRKRRLSAQQPHLEEKKRNKMLSTLNRENQRDRERARPKFLMWKYGLTPSEFDRLRVSQEGRCPICLTHLETLPARQVHIDHNHATGEVRGILCGRCNAVLGMARDDPATLLRAAKFLTL